VEQVVVHIIQTLVVQVVLHHLDHMHQHNQDMVQINSTNIVEVEQV
jgi:hypothetical protein